MKNIISCGLCINCRDKHRFGGPGIRKKSCLKNPKRIRPTIVGSVYALRTLAELSTILLFRFHVMNDLNNNLKNNQEDNQEDENNYNINHMR